MIRKLGIRLGKYCGENITEQCSGRGEGESAALNRVVWQELSAVFAPRHTVSAVLR